VSYTRDTIKAIAHLGRERRVDAYQFVRDIRLSPYGLVRSDEDVRHRDHPNKRCRCDQHKDQDHKPPVGNAAVQGEQVQHPAAARLAARTDLASRMGRQLATMSWTTRWFLRFSTPVSGG